MKLVDDVKAPNSLLGMTKSSVVELFATTLEDLRYPSLQNLRKFSIIVGCLFNLGQKMSKMVKISQPERPKLSMMSENETNRALFPPLYSVSEAQDAFSVSLTQM